MYHMTADVGSGEYALGTLMRPGAWAKEPLHDRLPELSMPVTFVYGSDDWMDHRHAEDASMRMRVPVKIIRVPDSGHQLYLEQPEAFNKAVAAECIGTDDVTQA
jgi:cardiolipin-specific phospholipase